MASEWYEYKCKSGETVFYHNTRTGEYRWVAEHQSSQDSIVSRHELSKSAAGTAISQSAQQPLSEWLPFICKSGEVLYYYNRVTGEQRWDPPPEMAPEVPQTSPNVESDSSGDEDTGLVDQESIPCISLTNGASDSPRSVTGDVNPPISVSEQGSSDVYTEKLDASDGERSQSSSSDNCSNFSDEIEMHLVSDSDSEGEDNVVHESIDQSKGPESENSQQQPVNRTYHAVNSSTGGVILVPALLKDQTESSNSDELSPKASQQPSDTAISDYERAASLLGSSTFVQYAFRCNFCFEMFTNLALYEQHLGSKHVGDRIIYCANCHIRFDSRDSLARHLQTHAMDNLLHKCQKCGALEGSLTDLLAHWADRHGQQKIFPCIVCGITYKELDFFIKHVEIHHSSIQRIKCSECSQTFLDIFSLENHRNEHRQGQLTCDICREVFQGRPAFVKHTVSHYASMREDGLQQTSEPTQIATDEAKGNAMMAQPEMVQNLQPLPAKTGGNPSITLNQCGMVKSAKPTFVLTVNNPVIQQGSLGTPYPGMQRSTGNAVMRQLPVFVAQQPGGPIAALQQQNNAMQSKTMIQPSILIENAADPLKHGAPTASVTRSLCGPNGALQQQNNVMQIKPMMQPPIRVEDAADPLKHGAPTAPVTRSLCGPNAALQQQNNVMQIKPMIQPPIRVEDAAHPLTHGVPTASVIIPLCGPNAALKQQNNAMPNKPMIQPPILIEDAADSLAHGVPTASEIRPLSGPNAALKQQNNAMPNKPMIQPPILIEDAADPLAHGAPFVTSASVTSSPVGNVLRPREDASCLTVSEEASQSQVVSSSKTENSESPPTASGTASGGVPDGALKIVCVVDLTKENEQENPTSQTGGSAVEVSLDIQRQNTDRQSSKSASLAADRANLTEKLPANNISAASEVEVDAASSQDCADVNKHGQQNVQSLNDDLCMETDENFTREKVQEKMDDLEVIDLSCDDQDITKQVVQMSKVQLNDQNIDQLKMIFSEESLVKRESEVEAELPQHDKKTSSTERTSDENVESLRLDALPSSQQNERQRCAKRPRANEDVKNLHEKPARALDEKPADKNDQHCAQPVEDVKRDSEAPNYGVGPSGATCPKAFPNELDEETQHRVKRRRIDQEGESLDDSFQRPSDGDEQQQPLDDDKRNLPTLDTVDGVLLRSGKALRAKDGTSPLSNERQRFVKRPKQDENDKTRVNTDELQPDKPLGNRKRTSQASKSVDGVRLRSGKALLPKTPSPPNKERHCIKRPVLDKEQNTEDSSLITSVHDEQHTSEAPSTVRDNELVLDSAQDSENEENQYADRSPDIVNKQEQNCAKASSNVDNEDGKSNPRSEERSSFATPDIINSKDSLITGVGDGKEKSAGNESPPEDTCKDSALGDRKEISTRNESPPEYTCNDSALGDGTDTFTGNESPQENSCKDISARTDEEESKWKLLRCPFRCKFCQQRLPNVSVYREHLKTNHMEDELIICVNCHVRFDSQEELIRHRASHTTNMMHKCGVCGSYQQSHSDLMIHAQEKHSIERVYHCLICSMCYKSCGSFMKHVSHAHSEIERIQCPQCNILFLDIFSLDGHKKTHKDRFKCDVCGKNDFHKHFSYVKHVLSHTDEMPYACKHCKQGFRDKRKLSKHTQIHLGATYKCEKCGRGFYERYRYEEHLRVHTGERPLACPTCGKTFRTKTHLWNHRRIHLEQKYYKCEVCGKAFAQVCSLLRHRKTRHAGERKYQCKECGKDFTQSCSLARHLRSHTGDKFKCHKCPRTFVESWCLKKHLELKH